ncbi:MAG TPA: hypothetical protein VMX18_01125 [Candidatus Bipolaricaulota bacterium]|nr:hypothetical protein [Candidatus Bipolaricaulota bacterium]
MDKQKALRIEEIFISSSQSREDYYCENFVVFPDGKENYGGHILGIIEIFATPAEQAQKVSKTIINTLKDHYYRQVVTSPEPQKLNLETIFEHALQKTNEQVVQLIQNGQIQLIFENINFLVAVIKPGQIDSDILFSHRGNIQSFLIHKTKKSNYKIIDIVSNTATTKDNKVKIFSSIISGKIFLPDTMILANESFARYFSADKISQMTAKRPLKEVIEDFRVLLHRKPQSHTQTYSAIFLRQEELQMMEQQHASQKSISNLVTTQQNTEKFLTPVIGINIKSHLKSLWQRIKSLFLPGNKRKGMVIEEIRASNKLWRKLLNKLKSLSKLLFKNRDKSTEQKDSIDNLGPKSKKLVVIPIIVLIVIFSTSIIFIYHRRQTGQNDAAYSQQVKAVEDKLNQAEASFLFRDNEKSLNALIKAKELLAALPKEKPEQNDTFNKLQNQYSALSDKLIKLETISSNQLGEANRFNFQNPNISLLENNQIIAFGENKFNLISADSGQIITEKDTEIQGNILMVRQFDADTLFILFDNQSLYQYKISDGGLAKTGIPVDTAWRNFQIYNRHLYFAAPAKNQIYKVRNIVGTSFGEATAWINDAADISGAVSMAIDGNIYLLDASGKINKFLSGDLQAFPSSVIEPAIENAVDIFTDADSGFIYFLDKATDRIVVLNKQGALMVQYKVENAGEATGLAIDEKNKKAYLISNDKISFITLNNLQ